MHCTLRRLAPLFIVAAISLGACFPDVTLLTRQPDSSPTVESQPEAATATPAATLTPAPTPLPRLEISPDVVKGLEVEAWHGWDGASASLFAKMAAEFNGSNPWGVKVSVVSHQNLNLLAEAVSTALGADAQPDLVVALPEQLLGWQEALVDLRPYVYDAKLGVALEDIPPAFWQQSSLENVQVGVPTLRSGRYLFYNVTWAKALGFENPPQTWDEFREQACAANAAFKTDTDETNDGYGGLALEVSPNWQTPYAWMRAFDGEVSAEGVYTFENEANLAALEKLFELREAGCAWLPTTLSNAEHLAGRKALFITGSLGDLNDQRMAFSEAVSADQWTLLAFPGEKPVVPVYGPDYGIFKSDEAHQLAAWLYVQWLLKPENQARWARTTGLLPVSTAALDLLKSDYAANAQKGAAVKLLPQAVGYPQVADWGLANKILADGFVYLFQVFPGAAPESVLGQMEATVEELSK